MQLYANNASSKLDAPISTASLTLQVKVGDGAMFPAPTGGDFFMLTLSKISGGAETSIEIVQCTARTGDVLTVVRAQESTTAKAYTTDDVVQLRMTALSVSTHEAHMFNTSNPHATTKAQVGLSNVDNTSDLSKPVSTAQAALNATFAPLTHVGTGGGAHANVIAGGAAGFMTGADKTKLDGVAAGATANLGTVTTASVVTANGFAGTVATAGTTPAITITLGVTGLVKGNGTTASAAVAGTDYLAPGGVLGTPSSGVATNLTGLPLTTGVTGTLGVANGGTGIATLAVGAIPAGNGTGAFTVATAAQVVAVIGATAVTNATNATNATNVTNTAVVDDVATATTVYPTWFTGVSGNLPSRVSSSRLSFVPSTGILTATGFTGAHNGTIGATTPAAGTFATLTSNGTVNFATNVATIGTTGAGLGGNWRYRNDAGTASWAGGILGGAGAVNFDVYDLVNAKSVITAVPNAATVTIGLAGLSVAGTLGGTNLSGTNTGDNAANTNYASDYRAGNFQAGVNYVGWNAALGTPTSGTLTNATGLPWSTGVSGKPTTLAGYGISDGQTTLVNLTNIRSVNGSTLLGSTNLQVGDMTAVGTDAITTRWMFRDVGYVFFDSGVTNALDYVNGSMQRWAPNTGAQTLSIANWPPTGNMGELMIQGVNLGAATITWPTINWVKSDGTFTTTFASNGVTLQASGMDFVYLWTRDGGTTIYGKVVR